MKATPVEPDKPDISLVLSWEEAHHLFTFIDEAQARDGVLAGIKLAAIEDALRVRNALYAIFHR